MHPVVETKRLLLRKLVPDDQTSLAEILCSPESMKYYPRPFTIEEVERWIGWNIRSYNSYGHGLWAVIQRSDNAFLGDCGITIQNIEGQELPEVGYHIRTEYCNKGFATEAAGAVIDYIFERFPYKALYSYMRIDNTPSNRVAKKNGMHFEKEFEKMVMGTVVREALYRIDK